MTSPNEQMVIDNESFVAKDAARIFEEVLDAEVFVNLDKVRNAARRGIPAEHRGRLYRFLLGVTSFDKSSEMTFKQRRAEDFAMLSTTGGGGGGRGKAGGISALTGPWGSQRARLRSGRLLPNADAARRARFERVLEALEVSYSSATADEARVIVDLTLPFENVFDTPHDIFYCTDALLSVLRDGENALASSDALRDRCAEFLTLFHATNEELYLHLVNENISPMQWVPDMLQTLLAAHLPTDDVLRLWDLYITDIATLRSFPMHVFVCLAVLEEFTETMGEMGPEELVQQLRGFCVANMEATLRRASSLREDVRSRGLLIQS